MFHEFTRYKPDIFIVFESCSLAASGVSLTNFIQLWQLNSTLLTVGYMLLIDNNNSWLTSTILKFKNNEISFSLENFQYYLALQKGKCKNTCSLGYFWTWGAQHLNTDKETKKEKVNGDPGEWRPGEWQYDEGDNRIGPAFWKGPRWDLVNKENWERLNRFRNDKTCAEYLYEIFNTKFNLELNPIILSLKAN